MGVQLKGIPSRPFERSDLAGKVVAIDAPNLMYAFYAVQMLRPNADRDAALKSAAQGLASRIANLALAGAKSVVIFDGSPHPLKRELLDARASTRTYPGIGWQDYDTARAVARALGAPVVEALHDAEAQACAMAARGQVDIVATTDWDALAMGAPVLLRRLSSQKDWSIVEASEAFAHLKSNAEGLALACILMGCDFHPGFPGIGPVRALKLAQKHRELSACLDALNANAEDRERAERALDLMRAPSSRDVGLLQWSPPDAVRLQQALSGAAPAPRRTIQSKIA